MKGLRANVAPFSLPGSCLPSSRSGGIRVQLLDAADRGRDNNFNLIRLLAALAVLVAHSWPLTLGRRVPDPLAASIGLGLGGIAVDVFFVTSGFLVAASLLRRGNLLDFLVA